MPSQQRLDQIRDLANQWEQLVGYSVTIPDWLINSLADTDQWQQGRTVSGQVWGGVVMSLYDFAQVMAYHVGEDAGAGQIWRTAQAQSMPWAQYGMSPTEYGRKLEEFDSAFRTLTGQTAPQDVIARALSEHQGTMTMGQFESWLTTQDSIKQQYGWIKYGLDFQQFQTQKLSMRTGFGRDLTDAEAVAQLQYHHAAQGSNVGVSTQQTLGQAEKKQAQTGVSGSVVR